MRTPRSSLRRRLSTAFALALVLLTTGTDALADRPRIGLALGGGGARGAAHIGVLKVMERLHIPVDYVAGTSMGAVVGALYAMGKSPERIEEIVEEIDWDIIFRDAPRRQQRRMRRKLDDRTFLIEQRPGVDVQRREINLLPALIQGQRLDLALRRYTLPAREITNFDHLPIPFRAVAADIETGDVVVLGEGDVAEAVRASMAVPAVFAPVEVDGRLLVDGGLAMNLPVEVVRDMGADIVIAVDVSGPRRTREEITHVLEMLEQVASLITWRNSHTQMKLLTDRDVLITPALGREVLSSDFNKMPLAVTIGERGAETRSVALGRQSLSAASFLAYKEGRTALPEGPPLIDYVRLENNSRLSDEVILARLDVQPGEPVDLDRIERQIEQIHDQDNFESVRYYIESKGGKTGLIVRAKEKTWGTSSIQGGLELSSSSSGNSLFNIGAAYTQMPVNHLNAEWRTTLQLGEEPVLFTEFYQPLDPREDWFVELGAGLLSKTVNLFTAESEDRPEAKHDLSQIGVRLSAGRNFDNWGRASIAYSRFNGDADVRVGSPDVSGYKYRVGEIEARLLVDTLDDSAFPQNGWLGTAFARTSEASLSATSSYRQAGGAIARSFQWGRNSLSGALMFKGTFDGDAPTEGLYRLGGFLNLSGFDQRELSGQYAGLAMGVYTRDLGTNLVNTYLGASLELGNVWRDSDDINFDSLLGAGSLFFGAKTFLGPLYLGYGHAQGGRDALYFILGRPWTGSAFSD